MTKITVTLVLVSFIAALTAVKGQYLLACNHDDFLCLRNSTTLFLQNTKDGNDILNIQAIDPLFLKLSTYSLIGATYKFSNITVYGLKDAMLNDFKMTTQSVVLSTTATLNVIADLDIFMTGTKDQLPPKSSIYLSHDVYAVVTVKYNYELYNGLIFEHFKVGPESLDCQVMPALLRKENSRTGLRRSSKAAGGGSDINGVPAEALCAVIKDAHRVVLQNFRELTPILPASSIISDIRRP